MQPILCAIDFSETSPTVMEVALDMASRYKTMLTVLFAYRLVQPEHGTVAEYRKSVEKKARENFESLIQKFNVTTIHYEFRPEIGFLSDRIEVYVRKNDVGMVVMSEDMANSIHDHKGQSLQNFIHTIHKPLLIVPESIAP